MTDENNTDNNDEAAKLRLEKQKLENDLLLAKKNLASLQGQVGAGQQIIKALELGRSAGIPDELALKLVGENDEQTAERIGLISKTFGDSVAAAVTVEVEKRFKAMGHDPNELPPGVTKMKTDAATEGLSAVDRLARARENPNK